MAIHSRSRGNRSIRGDRLPLPAVKADNRQWETDMGNGFTRVDNGAPPARLPSESQPVSVGALESPAAPPPMPVVSTESTAAPAPVTHKLQPTNWQREFGLGKRD
jgi:hypothetical protein